MNAYIKSLINLLDGKIQFRIPIYQRNYSWTTENCKILIDDILNKNDRHHTGAIVFKPEYGETNTIRTNILIDGQQRLTTISLIFNAIIKYVIEHNIEDIDIEDIKDTYLVNRHSKSSDKKNKIYLNKDDRKNYDAILSGGDVNIKSNLYKNFNFIYNLINDENINTLYKNANKLEIIEAQLDADDDAQQIFESLNSTGLDLESNEKIRNFLFMTLNYDDQLYLYDEYWNIMEKNENFDNFIRVYISLNILSLPSKKTIYSKFKEIALKKIENGQNRSLILKDMFKFSKWYNNIYKQDNESDDNELKILLKNISRLKVGYFEPMMLFLYSEYVKNNIILDDFKILLNVVESFLVRRFFVLSESRDMSPTLFNIIEKIKNSQEENDHFSSEDFKNSFISRFLLLKKHLRFPNDKDFITSISKKELYSSSIQRTKYILEKIENHNKKEIINCENYTIEHIISQNETMSDDELSGLLVRPTAERVSALHAAFKRGWGVEKIYELTGRMDRWFLRNLEELTAYEDEISGAKSLEALKNDKPLFEQIKEFGYSDRQIAYLLNDTESNVRAAREEIDLIPVYGLVDTCAAEFVAYTPYFYSTYGEKNEAVPSDRKKIMILGGGPNRIGQGIEFDYCCVHASFVLRDAGFETIMVNSNPATVSNAYDTSDRLYF